MLVNSSTLKVFVVLLYAIDVNSRVNPESYKLINWKTQEDTDCLSKSFLLAYYSAHNNLFRLNLICCMTLSIRLAT